MKLLLYLMNRFLKIFKNIIPKKARLIVHKIYFDYLMTFLEKTALFNKLYFKNILLPEYKNIIDLKTKSLIRHNLYENYEIEAIEKMKFWDNNFLDLGSSIGLCSFVVSSNMSNNHKHILLEPSKNLLDYSKKILSMQEHNNNIFINKAIGYDADSVMFNSGAGVLSGKTISIDLNKDYEIVECTKIKDVLEENNINSFNILIDIEGLSFLPLFQEESSFNNCNKVIFEEAFNDEFSFKRVQNQLIKLGFKIVYYSETRGSNIIGAVKK